MSKKPIACDLSVFNETERDRHVYLAKHFQADVLGKEETDNGFRFEFPATTIHSVADPRKGQSGDRRYTSGDSSTPPINRSRSK